MSFKSVIVSQQAIYLECQLGDARYLTYTLAGEMAHAKISIVLIPNNVQFVSLFFVFRLTRLNSTILSLLTFDENSREVRCDVLGDSQGMPGVNGAVGKNYLGGVDVIGSVELVGLGHGLRQLLGTDVEEVCALFYMIPGREDTA